MEECAPKSTPLLAGIVLSTDDCPITPEETNKMKNILY